MSRIERIEHALAESKVPFCEELCGPRAPKIHIHSCTASFISEHLLRYLGYGKHTVTCKGHKGEWDPAERTDIKAKHLLKIANIYLKLILFAMYCTVLPMAGLLLGSILWQGNWVVTWLVKSHKAEGGIQSQGALPLKPTLLTKTTLCCYHNRGSYMTSNEQTTEHKSLPGERYGRV